MDTRRPSGALQARDTSSGGPSAGWEPRPRCASAGVLRDGRGPSPAGRQAWMRTASPSPGGSAGETRRCLPVSDAGGARRGRPRCYFCYCSSFYHSVLRVSPSPSRRSPLVTQSPDVRAHLRLPTCPGVTLFSSLSVFGFGGTERRRSAPLCYQRLCNRGGRTSFLGATGTLTDPAAELREASREGDLG